jgi:hypothetical protein
MHGDPHALLTRQRADCDDWLSAIDQRIAGGGDAFDLMALTFRRGQITVIIHWLDDQMTNFVTQRAAQ